jgi:hypothetical protein
MCFFKDILIVARFLSRYIFKTKKKNHEKENYLLYAIVIYLHVYCK